MSIIFSKLTVLFEPPFWVALIEQSFDGQYFVCKMTLGAEPTDAEIYELMQKCYNHLNFLSVADDDDVKPCAKNPKRMQREAQKAIACGQIGTKAQNALKESYEQLRIVRKERSREQREQLQKLKFAQKAEKRKEKHKGH